MRLVREHQGNLQSNLKKTIDTNSDQSVSMSDWLMVHKVRKHLLHDDQRKAAQYVAMRLEEDPAPLSGWAQRAMRQTPLGYSKCKTQILFTNQAGERRAFGFVRAKA